MLKGTPMKMTFRFTFDSSKFFAGRKARRARARQLAQVAASRENYLATLPAAEAEAARAQRAEDIRTAPSPERASQ